MSRKKVLDYHDVLLYAEDIELLIPPQWLNDQTIAFWFEYLNREKYDYAKVGFCPGSVTYVILHIDPTGVSLITAPLKLADKRLLFLAVNDNPDAETANGGSHWSLLVHDTQEKLYKHYDSSGGSNDTIARNLVKRLASNGLPGKLERGSCPRQENGYDCGMYVLALADAIAGLDGMTWADIDAYVMEHVTPSAIHKLRKDVLELIRSKSNEQRRGTC